MLATYLQIVQGGKKRFSAVVLQIHLYLFPSYKLLRQKEGKIQLFYWKKKTKRFAKTVETCVYLKF